MGIDDIQKPLLRAKEIAQELGVTTNTVLRWIRVGKLKAFRLSTGTIRIAQEDYQEFLSKVERIKE